MFYRITLRVLLEIHIYRGVIYPACCYIVIIG